MKLLKTIFNYYRAIWEDPDGKASVKKILAIAFSIDFISNTSYAIHKWALGKSYSDLTGILQVEGVLILALLGISAWTALQNRKVDYQNFQNQNPPNTNDNPQQKSSLLD